MQEAVVIVIVAYAAVAVFLRYAPKALVLGMRQVAAAGLSRLGMPRVSAFFLHEKPTGNCSDGCGTCGGCGPRMKNPAKTGRAAISIKSVK